MHKGNWRFRVAAIAASTVAVSGLLVSVLALSPSSGARAAAAGPSTVPDPTVTAEPYTAGTHGFPYLASTLPLATDGYMENEYFMSGATNAYGQAGTWGSNGQWTTTVTSTDQRYTTRMLVATPINPADFSGTVVVEWLNDTATFDINPLWASASSQIMADGDAYVGVTAQGAGTTSLKDWDSERYSSMSISSDGQSYDIFSQTAVAVRDQASLLFGVGSSQVKTVIGSGDSQSAFRLATYADAIQNSADVYNGLLVYSRWGQAAPLGSGVFSSNPDNMIRTDIDIPVMQIETETDLKGFLVSGFLGAQQPDNSHLRTWEVPGGTHADLNMVNGLGPDLGYSLGTTVPTTPSGWQSYLGLSDPVNTFPTYEAVDSAVHELARWSEGGAPPPSAPEVFTVQGNIVTDGNGNAEGGLRLPAMQVPTATYTPGNPASASGGVLGDVTGIFFGAAFPYTSAQLTALYPTHAAYVADVTAAANADVAAGYLQPVDAQSTIEQAQASTIA